VFDLRGIVEEERRKNESRKQRNRERKHIKDQMKQFETENTVKLPSFAPTNIFDSQGTISESDSEESESDMMLQYYRGLVTKIQNLVEENQRIREQKETALMTNEDQRERFSIRVQSFAEQYQNLKVCQD
jgi:hypothetical protein